MARCQPEDLPEPLPWPEGTFTVKHGDTPPPSFPARLLDDVRDVPGPDRPPVGWSRL